MKKWILIPVLILSGCAKSEWSGPKTAESYYAKLDRKQAAAFDAGWDYGKNQIMQQTYAAEQNNMRYKLPGPVTGSSSKLRHKTVMVPVDPHVDNRGVAHDETFKFIRVDTVE